MMLNLGLVFPLVLWINFVNGGSLTTVVKVAETVFGVFGEAKDFQEIFGQMDEGKSLDVDKLNKALAALNARIESAKAEVITSVMLQSKLERIDDAVIAMHSSFIDLKEIILAKTTSEREQLKNVFVKRFDEHDVIKHIRFLPEILEYKIPGTSGNLVDLFADNTRCNMTAIIGFQHFYTKLLSDGILLEIIYIQLTSYPTLNLTINDWRNKTDQVMRILENQVQQCINKFSKYENEDISAANDAVRLWTNNEERYPWVKCDVMFLKSFGTFQFLYMKHTEDHLFWYRSDLTKIAIFYNKNETKHDPSILANTTEKFKSAIQGTSDENAAKNLGIAVEDHLNEQGYTVNALVVFFKGGDFYPENLFFDEDSPVMKVTIDDLELHYCSKDRLSCYMDPLNWFNGEHDLSGQMEVYAYVDTDDGSEHETEPIVGGSCRLIANPALFSFLVVVCSYVFTYGLNIVIY